MRRGNPRSAYGHARKGTFKRLIKFVVKEHTFSVIVVVIAMVLATLANISATATIKEIVQAAVNMVEAGSTDFKEVIIGIVKLASFYAVSIVLTYLHLRIMINVSQGSLTKLRENLFDHMTKLPISYFDEHQHGDLMSLFTNDVDATRQMISQSLPQLIVSLLTLIGYLIAMFVTSYILTFVMIGVAVLLLTFAILITKSTRTLFRNQQMALGKVNGYIEEMIEGQKVVKVFRHEQQAIEKFDVLNEDLFIQGEKAGKRIGSLIPTTINIGYLAIVILAVLGSFLISRGMLDTPSLIVFIMFARNFTGPINRLSNQMNFIGLATAGADRVFRLMEEEFEVDEGAYTLTRACLIDDKLEPCTDYTGIWAWQDQNTKELVRLNGDVRFKDVTFSYITDKPVLKNVSLYAKPGQKIAFVGATGAGKTTITNLINRFYDIQEGEITFDGINVKNIKKDDLRNALGMVLQDTHLFTATVKENIRYGRLNATDEEVIEAAKRANAHEFILKLPEGYDTMLTHNGENLSQGQRQLLSIARAAVSNPPVLILDEATSSVDTHTEKLIQDGMDKLMEGRTVFVIAHRLSTIQNSNAIIVLEDGEIIERGNHQSLVDYRGKYYQLYTGAFELE